MISRTNAQGRSKIVRTWWFDGFQRLFSLATLTIIVADKAIFMEFLRMLIAVNND